MSHESHKYYNGNLCKYCKKNKKSTIIYGPTCGYCNGCNKKPSTIIRFICKYYNGCKKINNYYKTYMQVLHIQNGLMEIIIKRM
jgi:hypothetical protein